jgi:hypothetical protein
LYIDRYLQFKDHQEYMGKDICMPSDRRRILELALESLQTQRKKLDEEIAEISRELRGGAPRAAVAASAATAPKRGRKTTRFTKEERQKRSERMKAYWDNWRKKKKQ